jgi:hypothetical protein
VPRIREGGLAVVLTGREQFGYAEITLRRGCEQVILGILRQGEAGQ